VFKAAFEYLPPENNMHKLIKEEYNWCEEKFEEEWYHEIYFSKQVSCCSDSSTLEDWIDLFILKEEKNIVARGVDVDDYNGYSVNESTLKVVLISLRCYILLSHGVECKVMNENVLLQHLQCFLKHYEQILKYHHYEKYNHYVVEIINVSNLFLVSSVVSCYFIVESLAKLILNLMTLSNVGSIQKICTLGMTLLHISRNGNSYDKFCAFLIREIQLVCSRNTSQNALQDIKWDMYHAMMRHVTTLSSSLPIRLGKKDEDWNKLVKWSDSMLKQKSVVIPKIDTVIENEEEEQDNFKKDVNKIMNKIFSS